MLPSSFQFVGVLSVVAGGGGWNSSGYLDGPASSALFDLPYGLAVNSIGDILVSDSSNFVVRRIDSFGKLPVYLSFI